MDDSGLVVADNCHNKVLGVRLHFSSLGRGRGSSRTQRSEGFRMVSRNWRN
jgi:hypothetical protein